MSSDLEKEAGREAGWMEVREVLDCVWEKMFAVVSGLVALGVHVIAVGCKDY